MTISERLPPEQLLPRLLEAAGKHAKEEIVNVADQLREEGRRKGLAEGVEKGLAKGQRETLLRQLRIRFGDLPRTVVDRIRTADKAQLDAWTDRVVIAPTLDDVLDGA